MMPHANQIVSETNNRAKKLPKTQRLQIDWRHHLGSRIQENT
jgi:hypothetical protein